MTTGQPDIPAGTRLPPLAILAGGANTRMRSLRDTVYKGFLPIEGASLVARHVVRAALFGVTDVVVLTDEDDALVHRSLPQLAGQADGDVPARLTVRHEVRPGSIEDKVLWAAEVRGWPDRLLVVMGDTVAGVDLVELSEAVTATDTAALGVAPFRLPYGTVALDVTGTRVTRFDEKPLFDGLVSTGYLCLGRDVVAALKSTGLHGSLAELAQTGRLGSVVSSTAMSAMDTPGDVARLHEVWGPV